MGPKDASDAVLALAKLLYSTMERLDPAGNEPWEGLGIKDRDLYVETIREILLDPELIRRALDQSISPTTTQ